jgi:hypothetical protein
MLLQLAEIVEMIHAAHSIHQSVMNIPVNISAEPDPEVRKRKTVTSHVRVVGGGGGGVKGVSSFGPVSDDIARSRSKRDMFWIHFLTSATFVLL